MDRVEHYRQIVRTFLEEYAQESVSPNENVTAELVFDEKRDRYLLVHVGWQGARRIYGCPMQIDIIDNKVWLQHNSTEIFVDRCGIHPRKTRVHQWLLWLCLSRYDRLSPRHPHQHGTTRRRYPCPDRTMVSSIPRGSFAKSQA